VLVVDDDELTRQVLLTALRDEGFNVREAAHGTMALGVVTFWHPDVILLDLVIPWMNGFTFAEADQQRPGPHAPSSS
jgi:CheY-like chemotaxis protein